MMEFLGAEDAADYIGITPKTLEHWRGVKYGPSYYKRRGIIKYAINDIEDWIREGKVEFDIADTVPQNKSACDTIKRSFNGRGGFLSIDTEENRFEQSNNGDLHKVTLVCEQGFQNAEISGQSLSFEIIGNCEMVDFMNIMEGTCDKA
jgi:hypothetical protein